MQTPFLYLKTTTCRRSALVLCFILAVVIITACGSSPKPEAEHEEEALARTEFTDRIENFFEYDPLKAGQPSQFLIHLTDLTDGTPIEKAEVTLVTRAKDGADVLQTKARVGKVTGIYVADVAMLNKGDYDIVFHVKNSKVDERMPLTGFTVE
jgi:hypothetical protein